MTTESLNASHAGDTVAALTQLIERLVDQPGDHAITPDSRFIEDIGMESVSRLLLLTLVEQEFSVKLEDHMAALAGLQTVGETAAYIRTVTAGR